MKKGLLLIAGLLVGMSVWGQTTIFFEKMGTVTANTTLAVHETANGFDNDSYTMTQGGAANPGDLRKTGSILTDGVNDANVWLTSTNADYGFAIEGIDASTFTNLKVTFKYRKESASALPTLALSYWDGSTYQAVSFTFAEAANAATNWYTVSNVSLPAGAIRSDLKLRWVKSGTVAVRLDEITLTGTSSIPEINLKQASSNLVSGSGSYSFAGIQQTGISSSPVTFTVENTGTATLNLSGTPKVQLSGTNSSEFSVDQTSTSATVAASGTTAFTVTFSPASSGSKSATVTILNNDSDEGTYTFSVTGTANYAPTASAVSFSGTLTQGQLLTGAYTYADADTDPEGTSTFQWYRSEDGAGLNKAPIGSATASTYTLALADVGRYISFEVTPKASSGNVTGTAVESSINGTAVQAASNDAPTASSVSVSGTLHDGQTLTGHYTYGDTESDPEGTSTFKWYRSNDGSGTGKAAIGGATSTTYVLTTTDYNKYISFEVTPVASSGTTTGSAVESGYAGPIANDAPVASSVSFSGTLTAGKLLTGSYSYSDPESNSQGTSTFKWYASDDGVGANKTAIGGATSSTYTLQNSEIGKYISFEVTPVASAGNLTGSAVESTIQGAVVANSAPSASSVTFTGTLTEGQLLTGSYSYADVDGDAQGTSTFKWYKSDDGAGTNKTAIGSATSSTYTLVLADVGKYISFEVTPVASAGTLTGTPVESSLQGAVAVAPVVASVVVNKYVNGTPDKIELLVIDNNLNMVGMIVKDFSTSMGGDGGGKFTFNNVALWQSVPAGTLIILSNDATEADTDPTGDYKIEVGLTNGTYFTNGGGTFDIATTEMVMIKTSGSGISGVTGSIHVLAGGTAGANYTSAPSPKLRATGTSSSGQFVYANNSTSVLNDFNGTDATGAATGLTFGQGNNSTNTTYITSLRPANTAPTASSVSFSGTLNVGQLLTGSYTYSDTESDVQGTSTFRWMRSDNGSGTSKAAIGGATSLTYTLVSGDNGKYISFEVTPKAATGVTTGTAVESSLQGPVNSPTTVQFSSATSSVAESGGTIDLTVSIANPSGSVATTVEVALTSGTGSAADINTYTTQTVTFPAGSSTSETVTLTVTDDAVMEGNETLGFTLQNVTGGSSATLGAQTTHTLTITDNDNASITLSGSATESSEDASVITVNLTNDTFEPSLTTGNWAVTNLPAGVTKGALNRVSDTQATITLSGNRTTDYDSNFSPIVTIDHAELVVTSSGSASANSGFTFTANDDAESITVAGDGSITEGSESGEILTVTLAGGTISSTFSQSAWTLNGLPAGLSKGMVTYVDETHVTIAITGTATDYDTNANVTVTVSQDQIDDYSGSDLTSTTNVVFTAVVEVTSASTVSWNFGTANPSSSPVSNLSVSAISQGNNNGTTTLLTNTTPSSGYAGASGTNNAGAAARIGGINTGASGSAYFEFSLTPDAGYNVTLSSISFGSRSTSTGPQAYSLRSSLDSYVSNVATGILLANSTWELKSQSGFSVKSPNGSAITYRIYGYSGSGSPSANTANWRIDDLSLGVTLTLVTSNPTSGSHIDAQISGNTTLTGNLTVSGTLTISGANLNTGSNSINLGTTGSLSGETTTNYIIGTVTSNPTLSGSSPVGIAGLGLTINPNGNNLGSTTITRRTGPSVAALGVGINRRWTISPTSQPSGAVDVTITWPSDDDNGRNPSNLYVWKSDDNGVTWQMHAGPFSTGTNPRSITFTTTSFSDWTVSDGDSPLPIKLLSWTATPGNGKVNLKWETASELDHAGFEVLRSTKEKSDFRLVASFSSNSDLRGKGDKGGKYSLTDGQVVNGVTYYYKLVDVALDGKRTEGTVLSVIPTDGKPQQPGYEAPIEFNISSIYPNPFNPTTNLVFDLPKDGFVSIRLYNVIGQEVKVIRNELMKKGRENLVTITTDNMPTGVYMVMVEFGGQRLTKKITFLK